MTSGAGRITTDGELSGVALPAGTGPCGVVTGSGAVLWYAGMNSAWPI